MKNTLVLFLFVLIISNCKANDLLNTSHLDYLYEEIEIDGKSMGIIHIYSNYPEYDYIGDDDEGIACIDDVARAAIFYLEHYKTFKDSTSLEKVYKLVEFVLHMQSPNGYFYNFIWDDYSINEDFKTSVAEPNWWSWRALWVLTETYTFVKDKDKIKVKRIWASIEKLIEAIKSDLPKNKQKINIKGFDIPDWLPHKHASDQAALLIIGLVEYSKHKQDDEINDYMKDLADGILLMQISDEKHLFDGSFLSWMNIWHAWGNSQSYALLKYYSVVEDKVYLNAALKELNGFYEFLMKNNFLNSFEAAKDRNGISVETQKFSQIAYDIRPMVYAYLEAYKITDEIEYAEKAGLAAKWFMGRNPASKVMYNANTGRVFDGIESEEKINMNSGAESTIEGLLSILEVINNPNAFKKFTSDD